MSRKLIIDGNAVYEIDEECMLRKRIDSADKEENNARSSSGKAVIRDDEKGHMRRG